MERRNATRNFMAPGAGAPSVNAFRRYAEDVDTRAALLPGMPFSEDYSRYQFANRPDVDFPAFVSRPLNLRALLDAGALRVTYPGTGDGSANTNDRENFSLVSLYNDLVGRQSATWPTHPRAGEFVDRLQTVREPFLYAGKYNQLVDSARRLGLSDDDIFMPSPQNR